MRSFVLCLVIFVCAAGQVSAQSLQPAGWDAAVKLPEAPDLNPDPHIVEINLDARVSPLEIAPGVRTDAWTYNGGLPGPLIRARVGDRLIVHFTNKLPAATTVHWHGVRVPIEMDGVPGISQPDVPPGGSFTYDFVLPDPGLFWYHPHVMSAAQVGFGLYGALLVEDPRDDVAAADELVMVLSDIGIDETTGTLYAPDSGGKLGTLFGREGNYTLMNGRPHSAGRTIAFRDGALERWRIVNTAKSRYFNLVLGNGRPFMVIGGDGGRFEYSVEQDHLVIAPGERLDVLVAPRSEPGEALVLRTFPFDRGFGSIEFRSVDDLVTFMPAALPPVPAAPLPHLRSAIAPMSSAGATPIRLELAVDNSRGEFSIKGGPFWNGSAVRAGLGETQLWSIANNAGWAHPIHLHGFFFQVVDETGAPVHPIAWKDTVSVPVGGTVRFLVQFDRPGSWMYHCHILDHAEAGLMSTVDVGDSVPEHAHTHKHSGE